MSSKSSNIIELHKPLARDEVADMHPAAVAPELAEGRGLTADNANPVTDPAPFAEPVSVDSICAALLEEDGGVLIGLLAPPRDYAGWVLSPAQATELGTLLIERARGASGG